MGTIRGKLGNIKSFTPTIGANGNWWIGGKDTGVRAEGRDGSGGYTFTATNPIQIGQKMYHPIETQKVYRLVPLNVSQKPQLCVEFDSGERLTGDIETPHYSTKVFMHHKGYVTFEYLGYQTSEENVYFDYSALGQIFTFTVNKANLSSVRVTKVYVTNITSATYADTVDAFQNEHAVSAETAETATKAHELVCENVVNFNNAGIYIITLGLSYKHGNATWSDSKCSCMVFVPNDWWDGGHTIRSTPISLPAYGTGVDNPDEAYGFLTIKNVNEHTVELVGAEYISHSIISCELIKFA